jgi:hypothetical protein
VAERNQDVVGSHGRCHVPNNHSKYRTSSVLASRGTLVHRQRHHPGPGVQPPDAAAGKAFDLGMLTCLEGRHRSARVLHLHTWQFHLPNRSLQPDRRGSGQVSDLDHVYSVRQRRVQPGPHLGRVQLSGERDLQELRLAGRARGRTAVIGDLGMRGEAR